MGVFWVSLTLTHHEDLSAFRSILWSCLPILCRSSLSLCTCRPSSLQARISSSRQCCNSWTYDSESHEEEYTSLYVQLIVVAVCMVNVRNVNVLFMIIQYATVIVIVIFCTSILDWLVKMTAGVCCN